MRVQSENVGDIVKSEGASHPTVMVLVLRLACLLVLGFRCDEREGSCGVSFFLSVSWEWRNVRTLRCCGNGQRVIVRRNVGGDGMIMRRIFAA